MSLSNLLLMLKGGPGSGNFGHGGRPGKRGGSSPSTVLGDLRQLQSLGFLTDISKDKKKELIKTGEETIRMYGPASQTKETNRYKHNPGEIWYGDNPYNGGWHPMAKTLQSEILSHNIPKNDTLYRGLHGDYARELSQKLKPGDTYSEKTRFMSTSRSKVVTEDFGEVTLKIRAKAGLPGRYISSVSSEILLPAGAKFNVISNDGKEIELEYLGI